MDIKGRHIIVLFLVHAIPLIMLEAQKPDPPDINAVMINPATGGISFDWEPSESNDVTKYVIAYENTYGNYNWEEEADTLWGYDSAYTFHTASKQLRCYTIVAIDTDNEKSPTGNCHTTLQTSVHFDSCKSQIQISWNPYQGWPDGVKKYQIYQYPSDQLLGETTDTSFIHKNVQINTNYAYYVKAISSNQDTSISYRSEIFTSMPRPPDSLFCAASVNENNNIQLTLSTDADAETPRYKIQRSQSLNGPYNTIKTFQKRNDNLFTYTDKAVDASTDMYYYKLAAFNGCGDPVKQSEPANNILLQGTYTNHKNKISWEPYKNLPDDQYKIIRNANRNKTIIDSALTGLSYKDTIENRKFDKINDNFCYKVVTQDTNYSGPLTIQSNTACITVPLNIHIPNAFTPNGDGKNDHFRPFFDFIPASYELVIYNRAGHILFRTTDPFASWDGKKGNTKVEEGVYVYSIHITKSNGETVDKTGEITVLNPNKR